MSRLRRVDKQILDQNDPIDSADQEQILYELNVENRQSYERGKSLLTLMMAVELPLIIYANHVAKNKGFGLVLVILSTLLSLIKLKSDEVEVSETFHSTLHRINWINAVVCLPLVILLVKGTSWYSYYYVIPLANLANVVLFRWWFTKTENDLTDLGGLRYKFKSV